MSARIVDGKACAQQLTAQLGERVAAWRAAGKPPPGLAVVLVGDNPASQIYVLKKRATTEAIGMRSFSYDLPTITTQDSLLALIDRLNGDAAVTGILVQLPLPTHIDPGIVTERIRPDKDVDGLHPYNMGRLLLKRPGLRPCTPQGCIVLLRGTGEDLVGKRAVVIGQSNIVGRPMALELLMARCTVTVCHSATRDLPAVVGTADILVAAMGRLRFVQGGWIKAGAIVIDVGTNRTPEGKLRGDVDFETAKERAGWITPVPGGVGPMTIAMLLANTLKAAEMQDEQQAVDRFHAS
jgi:methylenetetrahydrofolate dehydrogenase (NADP+)/methenyltetrahydrofolate cyclohydrolase